MADQASCRISQLFEALFHPVCNCLWRPIATRYTTGSSCRPCGAEMGLECALCGDSGAGRSTLSYGYAFFMAKTARAPIDARKAERTYITDDGSFIVNGRDDITVTGNCHQVRFRPSSASIFPEVAGRDITQRAELGKPSIEVDPTTLPGIRCSQTAKIKYVVFLNRREGKNSPLKAYSKDVVRKFLLQGRFSPVDMMPAHHETIEKLLKLEVLELRYRDLDWALQQLESLVETGTR